MDARDPHYVSGSESEADYGHGHRPPPPPDRARTNGRNAASSSDLPPLSLSILGVEPLDEFIREVADFVHHLIKTRPAELLVEISMVTVAWHVQEIHHPFQFLLQKLSIVTSSQTCPK